MTARRRICLAVAGVAVLGAGAAQVVQATAPGRNGRENADDPWAGYRRALRRGGAERTTRRPTDRVTARD